MIILLLYSAGQKHHTLGRQSAACPPGADFDQTHILQPLQLIAHFLLRQLQLPPEALRSVVMVGDRKYDILGARKFGLDSIGVGYGYAPPGELEEAGATYLAPTVSDLRALLL